MKSNQCGPRKNEAVSFLCWVINLEASKVAVR